ncbi:MAG: hypothetical protein ACPGU1_04560 [Myxococcota bacterium]
MTRSLITLTVFVTLACTAALGCSSEPVPGEPGAVCLTRDGETTPLYCVCGYPCVDGMCVEDPSISCGEALATPEPDIAVEVEASDASSDTTSDTTSDVMMSLEDADVVDEADTLTGDVTSEVIEGEGTDEDVVSPEGEDAVEEPTSDADAVSAGEDAEVTVEETSTDTE